MDIYIEYVIIDNLVIDLLLLFYTFKILGIKSNKWLILFAAIIGTAGSVVMPLLKVANIVLIVFKFALSCLMIAVCGNIGNFKAFFQRLLVFYVMSFALGGVSYAVLACMGAKVYGLFTLSYSASLPLGAILTAIFIYIRIIEYIARMLYKKRNSLPFMRDIILFIDNKQIKLKGLLDSGNMLIEKSTGLPVVIISLTSLMRIYSLKEIQNAIETGKSKTIKNVRFINFSTVSGTSKKMMIFDGGKMQMNDNQKQISNFVLGLSMHDFKAKDNFEVLLNPAIV